MTKNVLITTALLVITALIMTSCKKQSIGEIYENNKKAGEEYLLSNGKKPNVTTLASGVQYEVLRQGTGDIPKSTDVVKCHYEGSLVDGRVFDSSIKRGQPASFPVNGVILGWQEILQKMPVGSKWRVAIPYNMAYGVRGSGNVILPYSALLFDIELLEIQQRN